MTGGSQDKLENEIYDRRLFNSRRRQRKEYKLCKSEDHRAVCEMRGRTRLRDDRPTTRPGDHHQRASVMSDSVSLRGVVAEGDRRVHQCDSIKVTQLDEEERGTRCMYVHGFAIHLDQLIFRLTICVYFTVKTDTVTEKEEVVFQK